jgi:tripartite-type tricarboxylate transporter receptor subunit TctC
MNIRRRVLLTAAACAAVTPLHAQTYPWAPVRLVVPLPPGGASDHVGRLLAEHLSTVWGQPVLVDNRPGGNGVVGATAVARAAPDGLTLLLSVPSVSTFKAFLKNPMVDVERDLVPIAQLVHNPYVVAVSPDLPVRNISELVAYARANRGKVNFAGLAGGQTLAVEYFNQLADLGMVRVQYKGEAPALLALASNEVQVTFASRFGLQPLLDAGRVRALAITTTSRMAGWPSVPTLAETVAPGFDVSVWLGLLGPAGLPVATRDKIARDARAFLQRPEVVATLVKGGHTPAPSTPEELARLIDEEITRWTRVARKAGIEPQ